jgi:uncharacterized coiled-coil DUF342 family protein
MRDVDTLIQQYVEAAAERSLRITELIQEREQLERAAEELARKAVADQRRLTELTEEVAVLRRRLRRSEAARKRLAGRRSVRAALKLSALAGRLKPNPSGT